MDRNTHDLIERLSKGARISKTQASRALEELHRWVSARLEKRDAVKVGGFGTFVSVGESAKVRAAQDVLADPRIAFIPDTAARAAAHGF